MKQEYTAAGMREEISALENLFDRVYLADPAAQRLLDPGTMQHTEPFHAQPALDATGRGWQPVHHGKDVSMALYQAVQVDGRDCLLAVEYAAPRRADGSRAAEALGRLLAQYGDELRHDYVTGVYNRRFLSEEYVPAVQERIAAGETMSLALARVNEYAAILADGGNDAADRCLMVAAGILQRAVGTQPETGVLARLEDGVFLATAMNTDARTLERTLCAALDSSRREYNTSLSRRGEFHVTVAAADWGETGSWDLLLALAGQRLAGR